MNSRTKARSVRGWDVGLAAAILAVVLLGWLTAAGGSSARPGPVARPGRGGAATAASASHPGRAAGTEVPSPGPGTPHR